MPPVDSPLQTQFDRVLANLDDDSERLVYADMLMDAGDPRGEFIVLQLTTELNPEQKTRIKNMIIRYGVRFAGTLDSFFATTGRVFTRGFLSKCRLHSNDHGDSLSKLVECPLSRFLEDLDLTLDFPDERTPRDFSPLAALTNLRELTLSDNVLNLNPVASLTSLRRLDLSDTQTMDLSPLANLITLEFLDLSGAVVSESQIESLHKELPKLTIYY